MICQHLGGGGGRPPVPWFRHPFVPCTRTSCSDAWKQLLSFHCLPALDWREYILRSVEERCGGTGRCLKKAQRAWLTEVWVKWGRYTSFLIGLTKIGENFCNWWFYIMFAGSTNKIREHRLLLLARFKTPDLRSWGAHRPLMALRSPRGSNDSDHPQNPLRSQKHQRQAPKV